MFQVSKQALGAGFVACRKFNTTPSVCAATGELIASKSAAVESKLAQLFNFI